MTLTLENGTLEAQAQQAEQLQQNPVFRSVISWLRQDAIESWQNAGTLGQREELWMRLQVIRDVEQRIQGAIDNARLAADRDKRARRQGAAAERTT